MCLTTPLWTDGSPCCCSQPHPLLWFLLHPSPLTKYTLKDITDVPKAQKHPSQYVCAFSSVCKKRRIIRLKIYHISQPQQNPCISDENQPKWYKILVCWCLLFKPMLTLWTVLSFTHIWTINIHTVLCFRSPCCLNLIAFVSLNHCNHLFQPFPPAVYRSHIAGHRSNKLNKKSCQDPQPALPNYMRGGTVAVSHNPHVVVAHSSSPVVHDFPVSHLQGLLPSKCSLWLSTHLPLWFN